MLARSTAMLIPYTSDTQPSAHRAFLSFPDMAYCSEKFIYLWKFEVLDESRSFFRVHTGYFSNIPKCIKAEFIASWACSQSSVVSSSKR
ncbi:hypothetical protein TNCV_2098801 [Trichonephila clavipes]|nr:hypothetical protein TNCV_2098801 [Trichonephila clavipes]